MQIHPGMTAPPLYDRIGQTYNSTRRADPYLASRLVALVDPRPNGQYLDIGCGTGNYTRILATAGGSCMGMDPSSTMLEAARSTPGPPVQWREGEAAATGLPDQSLDGITAFLTIHHWPDRAAAFRELRRILRPGGRLVIFSSTRDQMEGYWLRHYFPEMMRASMDQMPDRASILQALRGAGLDVVVEEPYAVRPDQEDHFLYCGKDRPGLYLDPLIRRGISSFSVLAHPNEVERGLTALAADMDTGRIDEVIAAYAHDGGDYLFLACTTPQPDRP